MGEPTPVMKQWESIKGEHGDAILFFRLGDFYEMFYDDAKIAAQELEITLTARGHSVDGEPIPLAGVPYHSYKNYAGRLLKKGYKVAVCEQVSDPKLAKGKQIVERAVVRVLTPGTLIDDDLMAGDRHNYLLSMVREREAWGLAFVDVSTGDGACTSLYGPKAFERLLEEVERLEPAELVLPAELAESEALRAHVRAMGMPRGAVVAVAELPKVTPKALRPFFGGGAPPEEVATEGAVSRAIVLLGQYLERTHADHLEHLRAMTPYRLDEHMGLDPTTIRNLELLETLLGKRREGSLLGVLDRTSTAMGGRLMKHWILHPLTCREAIEERQRAVAALVDSPARREELREVLRRIYDIPRLLGKVVARHANPRDLYCLGRSLDCLPELIALAREAGLAELADGLVPFPELVEDIGRTLVDDPPTSPTEGGFVRAEVDEELDELRLLASDVEGWIRRTEEEFRASTGIRSLKIKYNKVMGYFIEVTKSNVDLVPDGFVRKQQLVGSERYVTAELKEKEEAILTAEDKARNLEYEIFQALRDRVGERVVALQDTASRVAELDVFGALAHVAATNDYCRPVFVDENALRVEEARHPVVEEAIGASRFVPNDVHLGGDRQLTVLTGPNMSGKSTYLRLTALVSIMAQIGSYVPARSCRMGLVDRVFTRVGATDDLSRGESTFMVEMRETAYILRHATERSLVILDEVGRGTSTYDGLSLAWAIVEYLHEDAVCRPKTLFATHYHELTELESLLPRVKNLSVLVEERGEDVIFLHRIVDGPADESYGIHVAKLAGFPEEILRRAREVLFRLEQDEQRDVQRQKRKRLADEAREPRQLTLFAPPNPVLERLEQIDPLSTTPMEALRILAELKELA